MTKKKILKQKKPRNKRKIYRKREKKENSPFSIFGINCAGIKSKIKTFNNVIKKVKPKIWTLQETKLKAMKSLLVKL